MNKKCKPIVKNLYPIFLFSLLLLILVNTSRSQIVAPQSEILLILDRNALYENNADTVRAFIQELAQKHGNSLRVFEKGKDFSKNIDLSSFRLIVAVGEKSLAKLSPEIQAKLKTYILGIEGRSQGAFLGVFFQEDQLSLFHPWSWYRDVKKNLEKNRISKEYFPLQFSASSQDASDSSRPMAFQHIFPALMPEENLSGSRLFLSYMAGRQQAFSHQKIGKLRNSLLQKHLEEASDWLLGKEEGTLEEAEILSLRLQSYGNKVLFNWIDFSFSSESEYLLQKSKDGLSWDIIHTRSATDKDSERIGYEYLDTDIETGDHIFRILKSEKGKEDIFSAPVLLSVSKAMPVLELFPNPAKDILFVNISSDKIQQITVSIRDSFLANPLWQTTLSSESLYQRLPVLVSSLRPGLYHVCVKTNDARVWKTFMKYD